ncbi:MAG TPA: transposase [Pirellulales bacterium]|nr:transposase [Pirellulales bacterium]
MRTYGTWLHGDERGSVDREHSAFGSDLLPTNANRTAFDRRRLKHAPMVLDQSRRALVQNAIEGVATYRAWRLWAINVRTNHVHVVVSADCKPERVMSDFKAWATRRLREAGLLERDVRPWSDHGSTRYLWNERALEDACKYVVDCQGANLPEPEA